MDAREVIEVLGLEPHPEEGGYFRETYRATRSLAPEALGGAYPGARVASTAIYYLLTPETMSEMHLLATDEVFHFYLGDPVEQVLLHPDGSGELRTLGLDLAAGARPQAVVPAGSWQGALLAPGGEFALMGCTVAPGFEFADYTGGTPELCDRWPDFADAIRARLR